MKPNKRVRVMAHMIGPNQMMVIGSGLEQTGIVPSITGRFLKYPHINIVSMRTERIPKQHCGYDPDQPNDGVDVAGTVAVVTDITSQKEPDSHPYHHAVAGLFGVSKELYGLYSDLEGNPWLEPNGKTVAPNLKGLLQVCAPDSTQIIHKLTTPISASGINIEWLVNTTTAGLQPAIVHNLLRTGKKQTDAIFNDGVISSTKMKLEVPDGIDMKELVHEIENIDKNWVVFWTPDKEEDRTNRITYEFAGSMN